MKWKVIVSLSEFESCKNSSPEPESSDEGKILSTPFQEPAGDNCFFSTLRRLNSIFQTG